MRPNLLRRARERIEALKQELEELEQLVALTEKLSPALGIEEDEGDVENAIDRPTPQGELHEMVRKLLRKEGQHVPTATLYQLLVGEGAVIGGKNPIGNLGAKLNNSPDLENVKGKGWWFKPIHLPPPLPPRPSVLE